jgi:hypothetical protein
LEKARWGGKRSFEYHPMDLEDFLPDYLGIRKKRNVAEKSLEEQEREFQAFTVKLKTATGK